MQSQFLIGVGLVLAYKLIASGADVYSGSLISQASPFLILFWSFLIANIIFILKSFKTLSKEKIFIKNNLYAIISINILTASAWITFFYSLKFIEPAISTAIVCSLGPIVSVVGDRFIRSKKTDLSQTLICILILSSLVIYTLYSLKLGGSTSNSVLYGIFMAVLSGIFTFLIPVFSKKLLAANFLSSEIMSLRFFLLLVLCLSVNFYEQQLFPVSLNQAVGIVIIGVVSNTFGLYLYQKSLEFIEPVLCSYIMAFGPLTTLFLQHFDPRLAFQTASLYFVVATSFLIALGIYFNSRKAV